MSYSSWQAGYQKLWDTMQIKPSALTEVDRIAKAIARNAARYQVIEKATGVPWYVIAVIHNLEGSMDFGTHLHNGNSLRARTFDVPKGRPLKGNPPYKWEDSAIDAVLMKVNEQKAWKNPPGWSITELLYKMEVYNGTGYRPKSVNINTPYLWAGSQHYTRGKYYTDGKYSPTVVSAQMGVAVVIRRMMDTGLIDGKSAPGSSPIPVAGNYGNGCIDAGSAGARTISSINPQSQAEALQYLLGIDARSKSETHEFNATVNMVSVPEVLDLDIQKTFQVSGVGADFDGEYTCDEVIYTIGKVARVEVIGYKGDPNAPTSQIFVNDPSGTKPETPGAIAPSVANGDIGQRIAEAAQKNFGQSSRSGPGGGNIACAWVLNKFVFPTAGIKPIGVNQDLVSSVEAALKSGRGQLVSPRSACKPGDIAVMGDRHIGICMDNGGNVVLSNSNSKASFTWKWSIVQYEGYYKTEIRMYRVLN
jgi:lysozyme family protein